MRQRDLNHRGRTKEVVSMVSPALYTVERSVAVIQMNAPPVNGLGLELRRSIADLLHQALETTSIDAIVLMGSERAFSGGADIREFGTPLILQEPNLRTLTMLIEDCGKPVIAAIGGACMGGGFELALSCHFRVAKPDAAIALPEVKLGLMPGAGGTQRLPRAVGLEMALEMIVSGKTVRANQLLDTGAFDEIVTGDLRSEALAFTQRLVAEHRPPKRLRNRKVEHPHAEGILTEMKKRVRQNSKGQPAPLKCLEAVASTLSISFEDGLALESQLCDWLIATPESGALRYLFAAERAAGKIPGVSPETPRRTLRKVGIIGAGPIACGIATCCLDVELMATVVESNQDLSEIKDCDLIIETSVEPNAIDGLALKPGGILAISDANADLNRIAAAHGRPADVVGLHFFDPPGATPILEVVRAERTGPEAIATSLAFAKRLNKIPIACGPRPGLIGERMLRHCRTVTESLLSRGVAPRRIERALNEFGMAVRPFLAEGSRARQPGQQTIDSPPLDDKQIVELCVYALANEGARILEEGTALRSSDIDLICIHACGFPAHRGGPMYYANEVGLDKVAAALKSFAADAGPEESLWLVSSLLGRLAVAKQTFA